MYNVVNKNRWTAKLIITALLLSMTTSLFAGCKKSDKKNTVSNNTNTNQPSTLISDKPIQITMLYDDEGSYPYREDWPIWAEIQKRTNVKLVPTVVPASDWDTKVKLLLSTGDAPDFISRIGNGITKQFVPSGAVLPISDYVDKLPNYKAKITKYNVQDEISNLYLEDDAKYYNLPGLVESPWIEVYMAYRMDIVDKIGLKIPENQNELYDFLKSIKAKYPNQYIWADKWNGKNESHWTIPAFGCKAGEWGFGDNMWYDEKQDKYVFNATTSNYKEWLRFMAKLVKEGIYDPETFTASGDKIVEKLTTGKAFVSISNINEVTEWNDFGKKNVGPEFKFDQAVPPTGPNGSKGKVVNHFQQGIVIPATTKKKATFEQVLKFVDWLYYSDEGMVLTYWGEEGTTYQTVNGKNQPLSNITYRWMNPGQPKDARKDFGVGNMAFMGAQSAEIGYEMMSPDEQVLQKKYLSERPIQKPDPVIRYSKDNQEQHDLLNSKISDYVKQMYIKFILGQASIDNDWDSYVKELKAKGLDNYVDIVTKSYEDTKNKMKK